MPTEMKHEFKTLPTPGFELNDKGFRYVVTSARPHKNKNGASSMVVTLQGWCAEDGAPFSFTNGPKVWNLPRRCPGHNKGWVRATPFNASAPQAMPAVAAEPAPLDTEVLTTFRSEVLLPLAKNASGAGDKARVALIREIARFYDMWVEVAFGDGDGELLEIEIAEATPPSADDLFS